MTDLKFTNRLLKIWREQQLAEIRREKALNQMPVYRTGSIMKRLGFKK